jgi:hypothetical protein
LVAVGLLYVTWIVICFHQGIHSSKEKEHARILS